ncbi:MAG: hypothetical protein H6732_04990 [Alphaproteobacteria bacterium]|nr:hypothetical protein [Alphaproteobacteria bacterium]
MPRATRPVLALLLTACGPAFGPNAGSEECEATCDVQGAACPDLDVETCKGVCGAYEITADTQPCIDALQAWQACEGDLEYTCFEGVAVPADVEACDTEYQAYQDAC